MSTSKWINLTVDRRGSLFIPMDIKRLSGVEAGKILCMRLVGDVMLLVPFERFVQANLQPGTGKMDPQCDAVAAVALNESWNNPKLAVSPPVIALETASPVSGTKTVRHLRQSVEVNRKGFIPTPIEIKEALGLEIGDKVMIEVQVKDDNRPVIVIEPMNGASHSLAEHLEEKRQQYEQAEALEAKVRALQQAKKELFQEIHELTARRDVITRRITDGLHDLQKQRAAAGPPANNFATLLAAPAKPRTGNPFNVVAQPEPTVPEPEEHQIQALQTMGLPMNMNPGLGATVVGSPMVVDGQSVPTKVIEPDQPPTDKPLQPGHKWTKDSFFGWIQVPDMEE